MKSLFSALGSASTASPAAAAAIRQSAHMTAHVSACWLDWVALDEAKKAACACFGVIVRDRARSCAIVLFVHSRSLNAVIAGHALDGTRVE